MDLESLIVFQIMADGGLCVAVVLLLWQIGRSRKKQTPVVTQETLLEFRRLVDESQNAASQLSQTLDEGHRSLLEMAHRFDEKERRLAALIERSEKTILGPKEPPVDDTPSPISPDERYRKVNELLRQGLSEQEILARCGLPEGEVRLLIDLHQKRNRP
jgi:hypothetical protein